MANYDNKHLYFLLGIYVKLKGDGFVKFGEDSADEEYLEKRLYVYGNGSDIKLPVGQYTLPFSFTLPYDLPSSFEGIIHCKRYISHILDNLAISHLL